MKVYSLSTHKFKLLTFLFLATCLFTGCIPAAGTPTPDAGETPVPTLLPSLTPTPVNVLGAKAEDLQGVKVHFWHTWRNASKTELEKLVVEFNGTNPYGVWVDLRALGNLDALNTALAEAQGDADLPDLALVEPEQAQAWLSAGKSVDLTPYVQDAEWGFNADQVKDFYPFAGADQSGTPRAGFPAEQDALVMYYNQSWAEELGFSDPPANLDGWREQACAASLANRLDNSYENNGTGGWIVDSSAPSLFGWDRVMGGSLVDGTGKTVFNTPEMTAAFEMLRQAVDDNCAWTARLNIPYSYFASRKALFYTGWLSDLPVQTHFNLDVQSTDIWTVLPLPGKNGDPVVLVSGPAYVILKQTAEEQLAAWTFIRWMSEPAQQARMAQAGGTLPLSAGALEEMKATYSQNARWAAIARLAGQAQGEPSSADWFLVRPILQDGGRQLFATQTKLADIPAILEQMDTMAAEIRSQGSVQP